MNADRHGPDTDLPVIGVGGGGWKAVLTAVLLAASVMVYFAYYKPFGPGLIVGLGLAVLRLAAAGALVTLGGAVGRRILPATDRDPLSAAVLQAALGLGILSLTVLVFGRLGLARLPVFLGLLLAALLALRAPALGWLRHWFGALAGAVRRTDGFERAVASLAGVVLAASLAEALAPPTRFDALVYHLALPQEFLASSTVRILDSNPYSGMPLGVETLYLWAMGLAGSEAAASLGWMIGALALAGTYALGRRFGTRAGWAAVAALLAGSTLASSLGWAYADWGTALYGVALLLALPISGGNLRQAESALAGSMAGLAIGVKYTAGIALVAGAAALMSLPQPGRIKRRALLVFALMATAAALPWLVRNTLETGAPLYPYLGIGASIDSVRQQFFRGTAPSLPILLAPLVPAWASLTGVEGAGPFDASIGPLLIGLLPGLLLLRPELRSRLKPLLAFAAAGWLVWMLGTRFSNQLVQPRLYYAIYPGWAALAGAGFVGFIGLRVRSVRFSTIAEVLVLLTVSLTIFGMVLGTLGARPYEIVLGLDQPDAYLGRRLGAYAWAMEGLDALDPQERALMLWEPRGFYCRPDCLPDTWIDRWYWLRALDRSNAQILDEWRSQGYTHLLLYRGGMAFVRQHDPRYQSEDWRALEQLLSRLSVVGAFGDAYVLYTLRP